MGKNSGIKILQLCILIPIYYFAGSKSLFLYVLSLSLYKIYTSCFTHITIKDKILKEKDSTTRKKLYITVLLTISVISIAFLLLGIIISDIMNNLLDINNTFFVFLMMGLSIITEPFVKITTEYLEAVKNKKLKKNLLNTYYVIESLLLLVISLLFFKLFPLKEHIASGLLYLSKIISAIIIGIIFYLIQKNKKSKQNLHEVKLDYKNITKEIFIKNNHQSIIKVFENSYYYISIIIVYLVLTTRYGYAIDTIKSTLVFIYFYFLSLINYLIHIVSQITNIKEKSIISNIYKTFEIMLPLAIIISMTSPLICKIIFNYSKASLYLAMMCFLAIFLSLYLITSKNIKNKKIIYISLSVGLIVKLILIIPLINSFYRVGYNLIYGDITSTIIGLLITTIINFIYIQNKEPQKEKKLEKILKTLYENILLCIILTICQFVIPIKTDNYFKSLILLIIYLLISIMFIKLKDKKRG